MVIGIRDKTNIIQVDGAFDDAAGNERVFVAIIVKICREGTPAPVRSRNAGHQPNIAETRAIAVVALQAIPGPLVLEPVAYALLIIGIEMFVAAIGLQDF